MARKLPWKLGDVTSASFPTTQSSRKPGPSRRVKVEERDSDSEDNGFLSADTTVKKSKSQMPRSNRAISTSPPPEALEESFMVEGLEGDDRFRMVEDEFLATAQKFMAHLHAAEYQKLKAAAKTQNAETIRNISRPVTKTMTDVVKKRREQKEHSIKQKLALKSIRDDGTDDEEEEKPRHASLFGLMESPRKQAKLLDISSVSHSTSAPTGLGKTTSWNTEFSGLRSLRGLSTKTGTSYGTSHVDTKRQHQGVGDDSDYDVPDGPLRRPSASVIPKRSLASTVANRPTDLSLGVARAKPSTSTTNTASSVPMQAVTTMIPLKPSKPPSLETTIQQSSSSVSDESDCEDLFGFKLRAAARRSRTKASKTNTKKTVHDFIPNF